MSLSAGGKRLIVDSHAPYGYFFEGRRMVSMKKPG